MSPSSSLALISAILAKPSYDRPMCSVKGGVMFRPLCLCQLLTKSSKTKKRVPSLSSINRKLLRDPRLEILVRYGRDAPSLPLTQVYIKLILRSRTMQKPDSWCPAFYRYVKNFTADVDNQKLNDMFKVSQRNNYFAVSWPHRCFYSCLT